MLLYVKEYKSENEIFESEGFKRFTEKCFNYIDQVEKFAMEGLSPKEKEIYLLWCKPGKTPEERLVSYNLRKKLSSELDDKGYNVDSAILYTCSMGCG